MGSRPQRRPNSATRRRGFSDGAIRRDRWLASASMSAMPERRTRPTIRCLRDDLGVELPTLDVDLGSIEHPIMDEARRLAPAAPAGQKRILAIDHPLVYRLRHGRWRAATWLEEDAARFWLLAAAQREAGSRDDAYEVFVALHAAGALLPGDDDRLRDALERNARVLAATRAEVPRALSEAFSSEGVMWRFGSPSSSMCAWPCLPPATRYGWRSLRAQPTAPSWTSDSAISSSPPSSTPRARRSPSRGRTGPRVREPPQ
jgi:hypothetical protein